MKEERENAGQDGRELEALQEELKKQFALNCDLNNAASHQEADI